MRLLALIILSIILSSHAKAIDNESRIIGGQRAKRGELPYMVALTVEFQGRKCH
jgi:secreted trypsin-like serine protease